MRAALVITGVVLALAGVRGYFLDWNRVDGSSMQPSLSDGDLLLVDKRAYLPPLFADAPAAPPHRGDVVVLEVGRRQLVKRVVGLPGDEVELRGHQLFINGIEAAHVPTGGSPGRTTVEERLGDVAYPVTLARDTGGAAAVGFKRNRVPDDQYFVLGDNRAASHDSRAFGYVPAAAIGGRVARVLHWRG